MSGWATALDRMTRAVRDAFPSAVVYDPDGAALPLTGVFDEDATVVELGEMGFPLESTEPRVAIRAADLGRKPRVGDHLTVSGRRWEVTGGVKPDGSGMLNMQIVEVS